MFMDCLPELASGHYTLPGHRRVLVNNRWRVFWGIVACSMCALKFAITIPRKVIETWSSFFRRLESKLSALPGSNVAQPLSSKSGPESRTTCFSSLSRAELRWSCALLSISRSLQVGQPSGLCSPFSLSVIKSESRLRVLHSEDMSFEVDD